MAIKIEADPLVELDVTLVGVDYKVTPPKAALALRIAVEAKQAEEDPSAVMQSLDKWIEMAFSKKDNASIQKRLVDPKDTLDIPHIVALMQAIIEAQTGNPTT